MEKRDQIVQKSSETRTPHTKTEIRLNLIRRRYDFKINQMVNDRSIF